jgi:hypothetical protein
LSANRNFGRTGTTRVASSQVKGIGKDVKVDVKDEFYRMIKEDDELYIRVLRYEVSRLRSALF